MAQQQPKRKTTRQPKPKFQKAKSLSGLVPRTDNQGGGFPDGKLHKNLFPM